MNLFKKCLFNEYIEHEKLTYKEVVGLILGIIIVVLQVFFGIQPMSLDGKIADVDAKVEKLGANIQEATSQIGRFSAIVESQQIEVNDKIKAEDTNENCE